MTQGLWKSKTADVLLAALNSGGDAPTEANWLNDSDVHKTLLTKEQWERPHPGGVNRMPELTESTVR